MSPFTFQAVQTLRLESEDHPNVDVQDGRLILTATRGGDQILISAPLNSVITPVAKTTVKAERRPQQKQRRFQRKSRISKPGLHRWAGENAPLAKLKESDIREIRQLIKDPSYSSEFSSEYAMIQDLASTYKVHVTTMYKVVRNESWRHVEV